MPTTNKRTNYNVPGARSNEIRYGAPDGPRQRHRQYYDGRESLENPRHEATARFLAFPKELRDFKSIMALAKHFTVTGMSVYRWIRKVNVLKRADFLSMRNKIAGKLILRREYPSIMEKATEEAKGGNVKAMEFCADHAFPEDKQAEKSGISSASLEEVLERAHAEHIKHREMMTSTWLKERAKRLGYPNGNAQTKEMVVEAKPGPDPAPPVATNTCDACGQTRCAHGRCPACDICRECD